MQRTRSRLWPLSGLLVVALVGAANPDARKEKVRLAVGSRPGNLVYLHIDLARALGYFEQEGLDVSFHYFDAGTAAAQALTAREYDFSANSIDHAITLRRSGGEAEMIASFT